MAKAKKEATVTSSAAAAFSAIDKKLWKPGSGCSGALEYMEQSSWILFLRYLDAREEERKLESAMTGKPYEPALPKKLRWSTWAYPTDENGVFDFDRALKGDDLILFVQHTLFPGLRKLKEEATGTDSIQYRIGAIFEQLNCRFLDGYLLREVIDLIEPLKFQTETDRHEMSVAYESRLGEMGNAGRDGGQYYTPRPLIRVMIRLLDPKVGEKFDDGACGSGGFLCEAYNYMRDNNRNDPKAYNILQHKTFSGGEVKPLAYVTAQMNCILHGLETPNITFGDTLANKIADFTDKDRVNVIGANPPFGAGANKINSQNFTISTSETALMFMEYFMAKLKKGGRAAIVMKHTFMSNDEAAYVAIRRMLLQKCQLNWVLDLPQKIFTAGVHTVVLFFTKDGPTTKPIRYYQLDLNGETIGKTRPLREKDLSEFEQLYQGLKRIEDVESAWTVNPEEINQDTCLLTAVNPCKSGPDVSSLQECVESFKEKMSSFNVLSKTLIENSNDLGENRCDSNVTVVNLADICDINLGRTPPRACDDYWDKENTQGNVWLSIADLLNNQDGVVYSSKEGLTTKAISVCNVPIVKAGTLLLSFKLTLGRTAIAGCDLYTNEAIAALPVKTEHVASVDLDYLRIYFEYFDWDSFSAKDEKVKGKTLNKQKLAKLPIILPEINVQRQIARLLKEKLNKIRQLQNLMTGIEKCLKQTQKSTLTEVFSAISKNVK